VNYNSKSSILACAVMSTLILCLTFSLPCEAQLQMIDSRVASSSWTSASGGELPFASIVGGHVITDANPFGENLYVCRAGYGGGVHPGKLLPSMGGCIIGWGGAEILVSSYEVLTPLWNSVSDAQLEQNAVAGGFEPAPSRNVPLNTFPPDGPTLFHCRGLVGGGVHPGKIKPGIGGCFVPWGGREIAIAVAQSELQSSKSDPRLPAYWSHDLGAGGAAGWIPTEAIVGGRDASGNPLYLCSGEYSGGVHPGKTRPEFKGCYISWGGKEISTRSYRVLMPSWGSDVSRAMLAGSQANGEPLYVCRAEYGGDRHLGKSSPTLGACSIGWGGNEVAVFPYEVLLTDYVAPPKLK
jgi:hypothetical protein